MKIVRGSDAERFQNADTCTAFEYKTESPEINLARIEITGRYPLEGCAINTKVTEVVYVESGEGNVSIDGVLTAITKGDVILVEKGEKVWWEGAMHLIISCAPAWTGEQYIQAK